MKLKYQIILLICSIALLPHFSQAMGSFSMSPAKLEFEVAAGQQVAKTVRVTNHLGRTSNFEVSTEDFTGTMDKNDPIRLLGRGMSPYSLKNYLHPTVASFKLAPGEEKDIIVSVDVPKDAPPGGLYGAVLVSAEEIYPSSSTARVVTRLGSLFFVKIKGQVKESGILRDFGLIGGKVIFNTDPLLFQALYENTGNIYINPYAVLTLDNVIGAHSAMVKVKPWYVLPRSIRNQQIQVENKGLFGRYKATFYMNNGYRDRTEISEKSITLWVLPWPYLLLLAAIILLIIYFYSKWRKAT